jgi:CheY-like chemotaxis protein
MKKGASLKVICLNNWRKMKMDMKKVLIVEDEMDMRIFLTTLLETNGYKPIAAQNGEEGEIKVISDKPDLILLDVMMPKEGGIQLYRKLKSDPSLSLIPVVIISAIAKKTFLHSQKMLNTARGQTLPDPEGYIEKPPEAEEVLREIQRIFS